MDNQIIGESECPLIDLTGDSDGEIMDSQNIGESECPRPDLTGDTDGTEIMNIQEWVLSHIDGFEENNQIVDNCGTWQNADFDIEIVDNCGTWQNADFDIEIVDNCGTWQNADFDIEIMNLRGWFLSLMDGFVEENNQHLLSPKTLHGFGPPSATSETSDHLKTFVFDSLPPSATNVFEIGKTPQIPTPNICNNSKLLNKFTKSKKKLTNSERKQKLITKLNLTGGKFSSKKWQRGMNGQNRHRLTADRF